MSFILDKPPTTEEFFHEFWNQKPFVVRRMISKKIIATLIDGDHLAGLSMEEEVESRLIKKGKEQNDWTCDYGPFQEKDFEELGQEDWSLLVQNTDKYHDETANLLKCFNFSPRWLLDDIMVSFSPKGGTVGAHTDSYHVFLVQGKGQRRWDIAYAPTEDKDDISLKILKTPFEGENITVTEGDVIYIPPQFAHKGISLKPSLTYSIGFLGPSLSDMLTQFGQYIEEKHPNAPRYLGHNLTKNAVPFHITPNHVDNLKIFMTEIFNQDYFTKWLTQYFSCPMQPCEEDYNDDAYIDVENLIARKTMLIKRPAIKMLFAPLKSPQIYSISAGHVSFELNFSDLFLVNAMAEETPFSAEIFINHTEILKNLLQQNILTLTGT